MVMFNSYVCLPEGTHVRKINSHMLLHPTGDSAGTCQEFRRAGDDPCQGKCKPQVLPTHERSLKKVTRFMNIWGRPTITACPENKLFPIFLNVESKCLEANVEKDRICIDFATRAAGTWYLKKWFKIPSIGFRQLHPTSSNFPMDNWGNYLDFKSEKSLLPKVWCRTQISILDQLQFVFNGRIPTSSHHWLYSLTLSCGRVAMPPSARCCWSARGPQQQTSQKWLRRPTRCEMTSKSPTRREKTTRSGCKWMCNWQNVKKKLSCNLAIWCYIWNPSNFAMVGVVYYQPPLTANDVTNKWQNMWYMPCG